MHVALPYDVISSDVELLPQWPFIRRFPFFPCNISSKALTLLRQVSIYYLFLFFSDGALYWILASHTILSCYIAFKYFSYILIYIHLTYLFVWIRSCLFFSFLPIIVTFSIAAAMKQDISVAFLNIGRHRVQSVRFPTALTRGSKPQKTQELATGVFPKPAAITIQ